MWTKRPFYANLPKSALIVAGCAAFGWYGGKFREFHFKTRDAIVEHYVRLHPKDFEHLNSKSERKFKDLLLPWFPIRIQENMPIKKRME